MKSIFPLAFLALAGACTGSIGDPSEPGGPSDQDPNGAASCGGPGRVVARRLSRTEYNNTLRDLFTFDVGRPADDFPDDVQGGDRDNSDGLTISSPLFEKLETATIQLAATAMQKGFVACDPNKMDKLLCARQTLEPFMKRAWRRPVTPVEVDRVLAYFPRMQAEAGETDPFGQAMKLALEEILLSPHFLFRFELLADP